MSDESQLISLFTQFAMSLPLILVCVIGLAIVLVRRLPKNTKRAATLGMSLLTLDMLASTAFRLYISSQAYSGSLSDNGMFHIIQQTYSIVTTLLYVAGIIFLLIAICVKESPSTEKQAEQNPYIE
jgi:hypothetical protein